MAYYCCIQMTSINNHGQQQILMSGFRLSRLVFMLALGALLLSTLGQCSEYQVVPSCGKCAQTRCPEDICFVMSGGPLVKVEGGCIDKQVCAIMPYMKMIISNTGCEKSCTSSCCMISYFDGMFIESSCFSKDSSSIICDFSPKPDPTPDPSPEPSQMSTGILIAIICGTLVGVGIFAGITCYLCKRSKRKVVYYDMQ